MSSHTPARTRGPSFATEDNGEKAGPAFNRIPSMNSNYGDAMDNISDPSASRDKLNALKEKMLLVRYNDETYDIHGFLNEHPGGRSILEKYENKDITRAFDDINHSDYAKKKLGSYLLKDQTVQIAPVSIKGNKVDMKFVYKKLFTKEDKDMVHKTFGFLSLLSYAYRYLYVYPTTGSLGFTGTPFDWLTLLLHFFLSFSSLIFHVVEKRIVSNPLIIYQEYRLHAIVFTLRGLLITVFGIYMHHFPTTLSTRLALSSMMIVIHATVDYISYRYGTPGITTVRNDDNGSIPYVKLFFAFYQVLAMSSHLIVDPMLRDLGWNTLIAIQSSAFLMTLKRKSLIRARTHFFWYSLALVFSMIYIFQVKGLCYCLVILGLFALKVKFNLNKYLMWAVFTLGYYAIMDHVAGEKWFMTALQGILSASAASAIAEL